jgi:hypothetical protein
MRRGAWPVAFRPVAFRPVACLAAASLAATCLLAGCTGSSPKHTLTPAQRLARRIGILQRPIIFAGGGGVVAIFAGPTSGSGARPKITLPPIPPASSSRTIAMPLEAYQAIATQQQAALAEASDELVQRCMAARGFDDSSAGSPLYTSVASLEQIETAGAGLTSLPQAQTLGFARPKGPASQTGPQIIGVVSQSVFGDSLKIGKAYTEALYGFSPGGGPAPAGHVSCLQEATQAVYGPARGEPVPDPVPQIALQAVSFTQTDPHIRAVEQAWSRCMARRFYHYSSPSQVEQQHWPSPPNRAEIRTAEADVACKTRTNLLNTWLTVEAAYQQALIGRNLAALSQLQANFAPLMRRAEAALAAPVSALGDLPGTSPGAGPAAGGVP